MTGVKTLKVTDRKQWRRWLESNFDIEKEVWLFNPKKATGKPRIPYNDAVEEALCFGWIDSIVRSFDEESTIQRFTPRNPKSTYSQPNKERLKWLRSRKLIHPSIQKEIDEVLKQEFDFPPDILSTLKADENVWANYQKFSPTYQRIRLAYIDAARNRPEEFRKRLKNFIKKTSANKLIKGYGGIEKYY